MIQIDKAGGDQSKNQNKVFKGQPCDTIDINHRRKKQTHDQFNKRITF